MDKIAAFVQEHIADDTAKLILSRSKWPEIDMDLAVACIESRKKLKNKVQDWFCRPELIFPVRLSAEQCSSSATAAYKAMRDPVAVESFLADAGMDIGDTLIGMHVRPVVVPCRLSVKSIGSAHLVCARSRAKFIGGERAVYK
mgnify:CR=1 FL=1